MSDEAIAEFWRFWQEHGEAIAASIDERDLDRWVPQISAAVHAIDEQLDWELGAGHESQHYLCLSGAGDMTLRVLTERWLAASPGSNQRWEFWPSRPGSATNVDLALRMGGHDVAFDEALVAVDLDEARRRIHVGVHHPSFAVMDESMRGSATFIMLDSVLGEDDVERWVGGVEPLTEAPASGLSLGELPAAIEMLRRLEQGTFSLLQGETGEGHPVFATIDLGIKRVDHLLFDWHYEVEIPLHEPDENGLTTRKEAEALDAAEDALLGRLGKDAVYIGRETRQGRRVLHLHAAGPGRAGAVLDDWVAAHEGWPIEVRARLDPGWDVLSRW